MELIGCDEHFEAVAVSRKGETTSAFLVGLVMVTSAKAGTAQMNGANRSEVRYFTDIPQSR
jgi:hypothetical protein